MCAVQQNKAWTPIENKRTVSMVEKRKVSAMINNFQLHYVRRWARLCVILYRAYTQLCGPLSTFCNCCNIFTTKVLWSILACAGGSPSATCKEECSYNRRSAEVKPVFDLLTVKGPKEFWRTFVEVSVDFPYENIYTNGTTDENALKIMHCLILFFSSPQTDLKNGDTNKSVSFGM